LFPGDTDISSQEFEKIIKKLGELLLIKRSTFVSIVFLKGFVDVGLDHLSLHFQFD
jgi:hypothetical protein